MECLGSMKYEIWSEGYMCTGGRSCAIYLGCEEADTFQEACEKHFADDKLFESNSLTYWGCKLYDNEADARKCFG